MTTKARPTARHAAPSPYGAAPSMTSITYVVIKCGLRNIVMRLNVSPTLQQRTLVIASPDAQNVSLSFESDSNAAAWLESLQQAICQANSSFDLVRCWPFYSSVSLSVVSPFSSCLALAV